MSSLPVIASAVLLTGCVVITDQNPVTDSTEMTRPDTGQITSSAVVPTSGPVDPPAIGYDPDEGARVLEQVKPGPGPASYLVGFTFADGAGYIAGSSGAPEIVMVEDAPGKSQYSLVVPAPRMGIASGVVTMDYLDDGGQRQILSTAEDVVQSVPPDASTPASLEGYDVFLESPDGEFFVVDRSTWDYGIVPVAAEKWSVAWASTGSDLLEVIPLATTLSGEFLISEPDGSLSAVAQSGGRLSRTAYDPARGRVLPRTWSAAFSNTGLLALGLASNQVVVADQAGDLLLLGALPSGSPLDLFWDDPGTVLLVNVSAPAVNDSGIFACDLAGKPTCEKILDWMPGLRMAHAS